MAETLFSPSWYRVAQLTPRLRGHTQVYRHQYRGEIWYILQDHAKGRYYRFNPIVYEFIGLMNGRRTVQEVWELTADRLGDDAPTQEEIVQLLSQLHSTDVLLCDVPPDTAELLRRSEKIERSEWTQRLRSPLAIRIPLLDPDRFLTRTVGLVRPLFGVLGAVAWLAIVVSAVVVGGLHWPELTQNLADRVLSAKNLLIMGLVYPVVKVFHELAHGYAVKTWGGEVHDMGIMFLVFMPVPYVDASAASEFRSKTRRVVVGSAGIVVELLLAAIAMFLWVELEPGLLRAVAYNVILIGSVSTLLFNGNPLLRYDGYYILSDLIEIPNMGQRGQTFLQYLVKRHAFRMENTERPHTAPGEPPWFVVYTIAAFFYRMVIYTGIILFLASKLFTLGILLAIWAGVSMVILPIGKGLKFVLTAPVLRDKRPRAILVTVVTIGVVAALLFALPVPFRTRSEGVVWVPTEALVRAGTQGFVERIVARPNSVVAKGDLLIECRDPILLAEANVVRAKVEELSARYDAALTIDRVQAQIVQRELDDSHAQLARAEERLNELEVRSPSNGLFVLPEAKDLPDRYLQHGDLIAFVLDVDRPTVRVVVPQSSVDLVRRRTKRVQVRLTEKLGTVFDGVIKREVPEGEKYLPSAILGSFGGGDIATDPSDRQGTKAFDRVFQFDVELTDSHDELFVGSRAFVRFDHGLEPIGFRWYRGLRRVFLKRFSV